MAAPAIKSAKLILATTPTPKFIIHFIFASGLLVNFIPAGGFLPSRDQAAVKGARLRAFISTLDGCARDGIGQLCWPQKTQTTPGSRNASFRLPGGIRCMCPQADTPAPPFYRVAWEAPPLAVSGVLNGLGISHSPRLPALNGWLHLEGKPSSPFILLNVG